MTGFGKFVLTIFVLLAVAVAVALLQLTNRPATVVSPGSQTVSESANSVQNQNLTAKTAPDTHILESDWRYHINEQSDLLSFSINNMQEVSGKVAVKGSIQHGYFFEGNILVNILDKNKNLLRSGYGTSTGEWMTNGPVSFAANLDFTGLPAGSAYIQIHNDNPSNNEGNEKYVLIPVNIK